MTKSYQYPRRKAKNQITPPTIITVTAAMMTSSHTLTSGAGTGVGGGTGAGTGAGAGTGGAGAGGEVITTGFGDGVFTVKVPDSPSMSTA